MNECPHCGKEYEGTPEVCPSCGVNPGEVERCSNCGEFVQTEAEYCTLCGVFRIDIGQIECENHHDAKAVAVCIVCGKPVCEKCRKVRMNKTFCDDDKHVKTFQNWAVAYISSTEYEAEMIRANLENAGIESIIFNQRDHAYFLTVGSMARVNVMVPSDRLNEAKSVIEELDFESGDDE